MNTVIDANVLAVANFRADHADLNCVENCIQFLMRIYRREAGSVTVDASGEIMREYSTYASHKGQPGVGDHFFKWLHDHQGYPDICEAVVIHPHPERGFEEFPDDPDLSAFDPSDRKYVAAASASHRAPVICNAVDSDWANFSPAFSKLGISVRQLC